MNFNFISDYWNTHNTDEDIISKAGEVCDSVYVDLQLINDFNFISDFHRVMKLNGMLYIWYNTWINIHIYMYNQFKSKSVNIKSVINSKL